MESKSDKNLPQELVHEILLRLPAKELVRCKCACKAWCARIQSPSFVDRHFGHETNQDCLLFKLETEEPHYVQYQDEESPSRVESINLPQMPNSNLALVGPSNGVFCAVSDIEPQVVLFNPATREFKPLPPLVYDGLLSNLVFGFGLDPSSRDYKVAAFERWGKPPYFMSIYNLSGNYWKIIEAVDSLSLISFVYDSVCCPFLNGVYHWIIEQVNDDGVAILALDMSTENFHFIQFPDCLRSRGSDLKITAYGDSLAVMSHKVGKQVDLWVMGRNGSWSKSFTVGPFQEKMWPLCVWKKNAMFLETESSAVIRYDISTKKARKMLPEMEPAFVCGVFSYKESLISIEGGGADCVRDLFDPQPQDAES